MQINEQDYTRRAIISRCNNTAALFGARRMILDCGMARDMRVIEVKTAAGLRFLLAEDRCLDIVEASFLGQNMGYLSKNGLVSNTYADPGPGEFNTYWIGGMLATCGLRNTGPDCIVGGEYFPAHGKIGLMPAHNVGIHVDDSVIRVTGTMQETALFGHGLELRRTIEVAVDGSKISVRDEVCNNTPQTEPLFMLYHVNFGFPMLDAGVTLTFPEGEVRGRTPSAAKLIDAHREITAPIDDEPEQVFFHLAKDKIARATIENRTLGIAASVSYDAQRLPVMSEWKSMGSADYALGMEPGTSFLRGRELEMQDGYSCAVQPFNSEQFGIEIDFARL